MEQIVTLQDKICHLQNELIKICPKHGKQINKFCCKLTCINQPYLCKNCQIHQHIQQIYQDKEFIKQLVLIIQNKKKQDNPILRSKIIPQENDNNQFIRQEQIQLFQSIEMLQKDITILLYECKMNVRKLIQKNINFQSNRKPIYYYYSNPTMLVNKLNSQMNSQFLKQLKTSLYSIQNNSTMQMQLQNMRDQFQQVKNKIKHLASGHKIPRTNGIVLKKNIKPITITNQLNSVLMVDQQPLGIFANNTIGLLTYQNSSQIFKLPQKNFEKITPANFIKVQFSHSNLDSDSFIGIPSSNSSILSVRNSYRFDNLSLNVKILCLTYLNILNKSYALICQQGGKFHVLDINDNKFIYNHKNNNNNNNNNISNEKYIAIEKYIQGNKIIICNSNSIIYIYKYYTVNQQIVFQFDNSVYLGWNNVTNILISANTLILCASQNRNILLYDLVLKNQIIRTTFDTKVSSFSKIVPFAFNGQQMLLSHNEGQNYLFIWTIQRNKKLIKIDPFYLKNNTNNNSNNIINSFVLLENNQLLITKNNQKQLYIYNLIINQ